MPARVVNVTAAPMTFMERLYLPAILKGMALTSVISSGTSSTSSAFDDPVPGDAARLLGAVPRPAHPEDPRGRQPQVRRVLHVRDGLPGRLHPHRSGEHPVLAYEKYPSSSRSTSCAA